MSWIAHQWRQATLIGAVLIVPLAVLLAGAAAPKRPSFGGTPEVAGRLASAGVSCLLASSRIAWFSDACEGQARALENPLKRGLLALDVAEQERASTLSVELSRQREAVCRRDPAACEAAKSDEGES